MSPHEMTTERIEQVVETLRQRIAEGDDPRFWEFRLQHFEQILKERAEAGTYLVGASQ